MADWVLAGAYWMHMAATVVWIGGLVFQGLILMPALGGPSLQPHAPRILRAVRRRFEPLAWLSLAVLIGTGLIQMSASPRYTGLISVTNRWSAAILGKHVLVLVMLALAAYQTWFIQPRLERAHWVGDVLDPAATPMPQPLRLLRSAGGIVAWNLILSLAVLALTALARVS
jgi:uncharacterized membrane protein